jgi:flagella synthesis protein FlgN
MSRLPSGGVDDALQAVLSDMQHALSQLARVLEAERAAVHALNSAALDSAGADKQALLQRLEQLDLERQQLLREAPPTAPAFAATWPQIVQSLRACQQLNQRNGSAVSQRLAQVREALSILTGHVGEDGLYGRGGELRASLRSQVLAEV